MTTLSDYNFVREGNKCVPAGPEPIPAGVCVGDKTNQQYLGSSGYRLIPGNSCSGGTKKDEKVLKSCDMGMFLRFRFYVKAKSSQRRFRKEKLPGRLLV